MVLQEFGHLLSKQEIASYSCLNAGLFRTGKRLQVVPDHLNGF